MISFWHVSVDMQKMIFLFLNLQILSQIQNLIIVQFVHDLLLNYRVVHKKLHPTLAAISTYFMKYSIAYFLAGIKPRLFDISCDNISDISFILFEI